MVEERTRTLVQQKEKEVIDPEVLRLVRALPPDTKELDREKRAKILHTVGIYRRAETLRGDVLKVRDNTTRALITLPLCVLATAASVWLWGNMLFSLPATAAILLFVTGFSDGVYSIRTIRALEKADMELHQVSTAEELSRILGEVLEKHFGYTLRERT